MQNLTLRESEDGGAPDFRPSVRDPAALRFRGSGPGPPLPGPRD